VDKRCDISNIVHFRFVVGYDFDSFSGLHASMYAVRNLEESALQVDALLETERGKVLGILVQHLSVENLITMLIVQPSS